MDILSDLKEIIETDNFKKFRPPMDCSNPQPAQPAPIGPPAYTNAPQLQQPATAQQQYAVPAAPTTSPALSSPAPQTAPAHHYVSAREPQEEFYHPTLAAPTPAYTPPATLVQPQNQRANGKNKPSLHIAVPTQPQSATSSAIVPARAAPAQWLITDGGHPEASITEFYDDEDDSDTTYQFVGFPIPT